MRFLLLAWRNLARRPLRTGLALAGLSVAIATLVLLRAFGSGYELGLHQDLNRAGLQLMLVPLGCPYDAAARILQGSQVEETLPETVLAQVRSDPAVAVASPMLMKAVPREAEKRTDLWVGIDPSILELKPWWKLQAGGKFPEGTNCLLGAEAAVAEHRKPGDLLHSPEMKRTFRVAGILERTGASDDNLFFLPLPVAQEAFGQTGRLTAVAIRLRDPALLHETSVRLQKIEGAQVVTLTEVMGAFLNFISTVRALLLGVTLVAMTVGVLGVMNTMLAAVMERSGELALMRAIGASQTQVFLLLLAEAALLTLAACLIGLVLAGISADAVESALRSLVPLAPAGPLAHLTSGLIWNCLAWGMAGGLLAVIYPAARAIRLPPAAAMKGA